MRFAAAATLYRPTEAFIDNLLKNADTFPLLFVYDNSSDNSAYEDRIRERENIIYSWDGLNHGLPEVFNRALAECRERDIDFLCMLDQDSVLDAVMAGRIEEYLETERNILYVAMTRARSSLTMLCLNLSASRFIDEFKSENYEVVKL